MAHPRRLFLIGLLAGIVIVLAIQFVLGVIRGDGAALESVVQSTTPFSFSPPVHCSQPGPEDLDGYEDDDDCPDLDNDGDGIPDAYDGAPLEPEDVDGHRDSDGIPDPGSILTARTLGAAPYRRWAVDALLKPAAKEEGEHKPKPAATGLEAGARDGDGDGLADLYDLCPQAKEDADGFQDRDGCPDPDNDNDGVPDATDVCPLVSGTDCDAPLNIRDKVLFATGSDRIVLPRSANALNQVLQVLTENPQIRRLEIQGHTDNSGSAATNLELSKKRAESVRQHLLEQGVDANRLVANGLGATRAVMSNENEAGRTANRRVEFHVLENEASEPAAEPGTEPAAPNETAE